MKDMGFEGRPTGVTAPFKDVNFEATGFDVGLGRKDALTARSSDRGIPVRGSQSGSFFPGFEWVDPYTASVAAAADTVLLSGSPVDSSRCSTETESSEEDDFVAGLAEQMAHFMLDDREDEESKTELSEISNRSLNWMNCWGNLTSENSHPNQVDWYTGAPASRSDKFLMESSFTPMIAFSPEVRSWDVGNLEHQSGEMPRRSFLRGASWQSSAQLPHEYSVPDQTPPCQNNANLLRLPPFPSHFRDQVSGTAGAHRPHYQRDLEEEGRFLSSNVPVKQGAKKMRAKQGRHFPGKTNRINGGSLPRSSYAPSQVHPMHSKNAGSGLRAVFLGGNGAHESSGTGVFLPPSANFSKKKSGCSTVLLPSRILEVLNLQIEDLGCQSLGQIRAPFSDWNPPLSAVSRGSSAHLTVNPSGDIDVFSHEPWRTFSTCSQLHNPTPSLELRLPSEWTY